MSAASAISSAGSRTLAKLAVGEAAEIFVETQMSESAIRLFGFVSGEERAWFARLQDAPGVGARIALSILDTLTLPQLMDAIALSDTAAISRANGVGKKLAERIVTEFKGKPPPMGLFAANLSVAGGGPCPGSQHGGARADARVGAGQSRPWPGGCGPRRGAGRSRHRRGRQGVSADPCGAEGARARAVTCLARLVPGDDALTRRGEVRELGDPVDHQRAADREDELVGRGGGDLRRGHRAARVEVEPEDRARRTGSRSPTPMKEWLGRVERGVRMIVPSTKPSRAYSTRLGRADLVGEAGDLLHRLAQHPGDAALRALGGGESKRRADQAEHAHQGGALLAATVPMATPPQTITDQATPDAMSTTSCSAGTLGPAPIFAPKTASWTTSPRTIAIHAAVKMVLEEISRRGAGAIAAGEPVAGCVVMARIYASYASSAPVAQGAYATGGVCDISARLFRAAGAMPESGKCWTSRQSLGSRASVHAPACRARPTSPPMTVPLMRMNCRSWPTLVSSFSTMVRVSHARIVSETQLADVVAVPVGQVDQQRTDAHVERLAHLGLAQQARAHVGHRAGQPFAQAAVAGPRSRGAAPP